MPRNAKYAIFPIRSDHHVSGSSSSFRIVVALQLRGRLSNTCRLATVIQKQTMSAGTFSSAITTRSWWTGQAIFNYRRYSSLNRMSFDYG
ncbi:Uncharacterized protein HZ326_15009 [Fusarium oxysporum f. sp. albedinis]|nr:Uncharacterized protein HZ326_15009 [Fusarium oxysporum f. sp. albedinis]